MSFAGLQNAVFIQDDSFVSSGFFAVYFNRALVYQASGLVFAFCYAGFDKYGRYQFAFGVFKFRHIVRVFLFGENLFKMLQPGFGAFFPVETGYQYLSQIFF